MEFLSVSLPDDVHGEKSSLNLGFYFRTRLCFSSNVEKSLVAVTFLATLDDVTCCTCSRGLSVTIRLPALTHRCELFSGVEGPALHLVGSYMSEPRIYEVCSCNASGFLYCRGVAEGTQCVPMTSFCSLSKTLRQKLDRGNFGFSAPSDWNVS